MLTEIPDNARVIKQEIRERFSETSQTQHRLGRAGFLREISADLDVFGTPNLAKSGRRF
jgi:hypothetical protein